MADTKLKASCYYPLVVRALRSGQENLTVHLDGGNSGKITVKVASARARAARIEATALIDLSAVSENAGQVGAAYWSGKWRSRWYAPYGLGNRGNALVPGRDFAHGGAAGAAWPHGTRIEFTDIPEKLEGLIRPVMYRGDVFGDSDAASNPRRCDLYTTEPCAYYGPISVRVTKPWRGNRNHKISAETVRGFQQCARLLGLKGKNGKLLNPDNDWGPETEHAIKLFLAEFDGLFHWAVPDFIKDRPRPWDSEIYFLARLAAKEKVS